MSKEIKVEQGPKREFSTGAQRQASSGKGTPSLVPGDAILDIAKHFEKGAAIYGARNWEKGLPLSSILDSLERHLQQEKMGLTTEPHARALAWNAVIYLATKIRITDGTLPADLNDMPVYHKCVDGPAVELPKILTEDGKAYCIIGLCFERGYPNTENGWNYLCPKHITKYSTETKEIL